MCALHIYIYIWILYASIGVQSPFCTNYLPKMLKLYESLANEVFLMCTSGLILAVNASYVVGSMLCRVTIRAISLQFTTFHLNQAKLCRIEAVHIGT